MLLIRNSPYLEGGNKKNRPKVIERFIREIPKNKIELFNPYFFVNYDTFSGNEFNSIVTCADDVEIDFID